MAMYKFRYHCPFCHKELVPGELKRYETIAEHVSEPNQEWYPLRPTLICDCENSKGAFWEPIMGDFYTEIDYYDKHPSISISTDLHAIIVH